MDINTLYDRLSSVRLTIFLCILLAIVSVVGTVIPQNLTAEQYRNLYGQGGAELVMGLGLSDLYHAVGFVLLLCLLAANLVACTAKRLPGTWRSLRRDASPPSDAAFENWKCREAFVCSASVEEMEDRLEGIVAKAFGKKPRRKAVESRGQVLLVERNRYARLGPYVAHVSLLLILLGTLWGAVQGFKGGLQLAEGEASSEVWARTGAERIPLGFEIRCDRFVFEQYPNGTPKEYRSEVTLSEVEGQTIKSGTIRVNHPLTYRGITFYQSTYGSIPELKLRVIDRQGGAETLVTTRLNAPFLLPGSQGDRAMVVAFEENLRIPEEMARITSFSNRSLGPAARLVVFDDKGFGEPFWVFRDLPDMGKKAQRAHEFVMKDFRLMSYTGLQVVKDPGTPLVWIGCTFLVIGFLMALLMDHEIVWVAGEVAGEKEYRVRVAGRAVRHPGIYGSRFDRQKLRLRKGLSPWLKKPLGDL
jgi:cytochrome c biogenesis protein